MTDSLPIVDPEFEALIPPLAEEELSLLEHGLLVDGCRDALVVWKETGILLDGHNRLRICREHGLPFRTVEVSIADRSAAEDWIDTNQLGRRNLSPDAASRIRGRVYNRTRKPVGAPEGNANAEKQIGKTCHFVSDDTLQTDVVCKHHAPKKLVDLFDSKSQPEPSAPDDFGDMFDEAAPAVTTRKPSAPSAPVRSLADVLAGDPTFVPEEAAAKVQAAPAKTAERLAVLYGVSERTIRNDGQFAAAVDALKATQPDIEKRVMSGDIPSRSAVVEAAKNPEKATEILAAKPHVANNSGENEWYTPAAYIELARSVMGRIDLDPASCAQANQTVQADAFFCKEDNGLDQEWHGAVWLNPPYAQPMIAQFSDKLVLEFKTGRTSQACVLVNNGTETGWGQALLSACSAVCFPQSRVRFLDPCGKLGAPLQGQMLLYFGSSEGVGRFKFHADKFGIVKS